MLCLFKCSLLPVKSDLRIALAVSDTSHAEVHADLGALTCEVCLQLVEDVLLILLGNIRIILHGLCIYTELMLSRETHVLFHLLKCSLLCLTYRALIRCIRSFINVTTYRTYKLCHTHFLLV